MTEFVLIANRYETSFSKKINELLSHGWQFYGPIFINSDGEYVQALIKPSATPLEAPPSPANPTEATTLAKTNNTAPKRDLSNYESDYDKGYKTGFENGEVRGHAQGYKDGYSEGYIAGKASSDVPEGMQNTCQRCRERL